MSYVIHHPSQPTFSRVDVTGTIFPTTDLIHSTEFLLIETKIGHETTIIEEACDFCYFILEGSGYFIVKGQKETCEVGDLVIIPKGTPFTYKGQLKILLSVTPPFYPEQEVVVK